MEGGFIILGIELLMPASKFLWRKARCWVARYCVVLICCWDSYYPGPGNYDSYRNLE